MVETMNAAAAASTSPNAPSTIFFMVHVSRVFDRPVEGRAGSRAVRSRSELAEESEVVLEEEPDLGDAVPQHRDALEPHAEREARDLLGIVAHGAEHVGVHHPGAQHLEPARALAHAAAALAAV